MQAEEDTAPSGLVPATEDTMRTTIRNTALRAPQQPIGSASFLAEMSELMGLPAESGDVLMGPSPFWGPGGLMCRLQVSSSHGEVMAVQPQVMLPMPADELKGQEVGRLLDIQAALLSETGWCLGVSREGMMQLSLMSWIDEPGQAVEALDLGNAVALQTLYLLLGGEEDEGSESDDDDVDLASGSPGCSGEVAH
jgi:hypothetical protein